MKLCYKVCIAKCIEVNFQQIYDYIRTHNPNFSLEDIEWLKRNAEDYVVTCYDKGELDSEGLLMAFRKAMEE